MISPRLESALERLGLGGGVSEYSWQFNDAGGHSAPVESRTPTIEHEFPGRGTYQVALTVFAEDGTSIGTVRSVEAGEALPTAAFTFEPASPVAQSPVQFNGAGSTDPGGAISSYMWSFGDGTSGEGQAPAHTYALPGFYDVELTVTDTVGERASSVQTILVEALAPAVVTGEASAGTSTATLPR